MKTIITCINVALFILLTSSCSTDDLIAPPRDTFTKEIVYCADDQVIRIDDQWMLSVDPENFIPLNPILGAYLFNGNLEIESLTYDISSVNLREVDHEVEIRGKKATIRIPDLEEYQVDTNFFFLDVEFFTN